MTVSDLMRLVFGVITVIGCPVGYVLLNHAMRKAKISRPPTLSFLFIFGTIGGWSLAIALSPGGLAAICTIILVPSLTIALLISSIYLVVRPERSRFHLIAIRVGFSYVSLLILSVLFH